MKKNWLNQSSKKIAKKVKIDMAKFYADYCQSDNFTQDCDRLTETIGSARGLRPIA